MRTLLLYTACIVLMIGVLGRAEAAPVNFADHLECRDIKDSATERKYTADFASNELLRQDGCVVKVPAKQVCWAVLNDGISPTPFSAPNGTNLNGKYYLCYKMECPKDEHTFVLSDKLGGGRSVQLKRARRICVPGY
jgi:hypothetical protein